MHAALAAAAALVATAFALSTLERWQVRRRRHELVWTISLAMFAAGSLSLWAGAAVGWSEWTYKPFYLFGAILNVPFLALGTVYLLGRQRTGDVWTAVVALLGAFAAGMVVTSTPRIAFDAAVLPQGSEVFGPGPRIAAALASGVGATVIIVGAVWSAARLLRGSRRAAPSAPPSGLSPRRLASANLVIALGTLILSASGLFNSVLDEMDAFAVTLVIGISTIFVGFLLTVTGRPAANPTPWRPHPTVAQRMADGSLAVRLDRVDAGADPGSVGEPALVGSGSARVAD